MTAPHVWDGLPPVAPADQPLLADRALQAQLDEVGFVVVPLLDDAALERLVLDHAELHPEPGHGFEIDLASVSSDHKRRVDQALQPVWQDLLAPHLIEPQFFMSSFVVKWPGEASALPVHQDWSTVDEERDRSLVAWLALDDISPEIGNGTLAVLPGSHRFLAPPRGAMTIPWYWEYGTYIAEHLHPLRLRAGEVALLDGRLIHASAPNVTASPRRAAVTRIARRTTPLVYVDHTGAGLDLYEVDHEFYIERGPLDLRSRPPDRHRIIGRRSDAVPEVDPIVLAAVCGASDVPERSGAPLTRDQLLGAPLAPAHPPSGAEADPGGSSKGGAPALAAVRSLLDAARHGLARQTQPVTWPIDGPSTARAVASGAIDPGAGAPADWSASHAPFEHQFCSLPLPATDPAIAAALAAVRGRVLAAYLAVLQPGGRIRLPGEPGEWSGVLVVDAPAVHGAAALRMGDRHVPLATGVTSVFPATDDQEMWNVGGRPCVVLGWRAEVSSRRAGRAVNG